MELNVHFIHPDGRRESFPGVPGETLLDVALDNGVAGIIGHGGGGATCCTCHCWIGESWLPKLAPVQRNEREMLEYAWGCDHRSRLACQVDLTEHLSGIEVWLPEQQS